MKNTMIHTQFIHFFTKMYHKHDSITNIHLVDCVWSAWEIGDCSKTCGDGERPSTRRKLVEEADCGMCSGSSTRTELCNDKACPGR